LFCRWNALSEKVPESTFIKNVGVSQKLLAGPTLLPVCEESVLKWALQRYSRLLSGLVHLQITPKKENFEANHPGCPGVFSPQKTDATSFARPACGSFPLPKVKGIPG
jgi:hypothetical protein